jgi:hypothetical protein
MGSDEMMKLADLTLAQLGEVRRDLERQRSAINSKVPPFGLNRAFWRAPEGRAVRARLTPVEDALHSVELEWHRRSRPFPSDGSPHYGRVSPAGTRRPTHLDD